MEALIQLGKIAPTAVGLGLVGMILLFLQQTKVLPFFPPEKSHKLTRYTLRASFIGVFVGMMLIFLKGFEVVLLHLNTRWLSMRFRLVGPLFLLSALTPHATAQTSPEADIMNVMRARVEAYYTGDLKKLQSFCVQDSSNSRTIITKSYYSSQTGWPNVLAVLTKDIQENDINFVTVAYENVHIRTSGNLAFVEADERQAWQGVDPKEIPVFRVYNVLVKEKTGWKTANTVRVDPASFANTPTNREYELNAIGYDLLREKRLPEAIDVFRVNIKLNPNSWNAYDSLGEACVLSGDTKQAIANYEKSVELNPKSESGLKALARLKKP
jgi:hypothetical protein